MAKRKVRNVKITPKAMLVKRHVTSLKSEADKKRTIVEIVTDFLTEKFGSSTFLFINILWFAIWIPVNLNLVPGVKAFDPFPFGLLTMIVSLEAIVLSIIVLISQNRESKVANLREELHLQIETIIEREITKLVNMQIMLMRKNGFSVKSDPDFDELTQPINTKKITQKLEEQIL